MFWFVVEGVAGVGRRDSPKGAEPVTADQGAQLGIAGGDALRDDVVRPEGADGVLDLRR